MPTYHLVRLSCFKSAMGTADFELFLGAPLMEAAENQSVKPLLVVCLERGSFMVIGTRLMGAHLGGWSEDSQGCVTALARNHPELVFLAFGAPDVASDPSHPGEVHGVLLDMYECLDTPEKVRFTVSMMSNSLEAAPFTGQHFLETLPESEVDCLNTNLPEPVFAMIADAPSVAGGQLRDAPPELLACISPESLSRIPAEILTLGMGVTSDDSRACVVLDFVSAHGHYIELVQAFAEHAENLSPEDFLEIAEDGWKLFNCLTDEELAQFQENYAPSMVP